jgi:hypothetical protein
VEAGLIGLPVHHRWIWSITPPYPQWAPPIHMLKPYIPGSQHVTVFRDER